MLFRPGTTKERGTDLEVGNSLKPAHAPFLGWPGHPRKPLPLNPFGLPSPLTWKQTFYLGFTQCIGAATISGMANFGIACAMYRTVKPPKTILMWPLAHNTIAGDCAVTIFIQGTLTFVMVSALVHNDLRLKRIDPFPMPWPSTEYNIRELDVSKAKTIFGRLFRRFHNTHGLSRGLHFFSGSDAQDLLDFGIPPKRLLFRWLLGAWKGTVLSALFFFVWWSIFVAICAPIWGGQDMRGTWTPQLIKLIFAFTYALVQNPLVACIALGSEDACRDHLRDTQIKRWQDMHTFEVTADEKPRQSVELSSLSLVEVNANTNANASRRDLARPSLESAPASTRTSLDMSRVAQTLGIPDMQGRDVTSIRPGRSSFDGSLYSTRRLSYNGELLNRSTSLDSRLPARPSVARSRSQFHFTPRRLTVVQQDVPREYPYAQSRQP